jgi:hypothetical protein
MTFHTLYRNNNNDDVAEGRRQQHCAKGKDNEVCQWCGMSGGDEAVITLSYLTSSD